MYISFIFPTNNTNACMFINDTKIVLSSIFLTILMVHGVNVNLHLDLP